MTQDGWREFSIPMLGVGSSHGRLVDLIALLHPRRGPAPGMAGDLVRRLPRLRVHGHREHRLRLDLEVDGIRVDNLAARDGDRVLALEGEAHQRLGVDAVDTDAGPRGHGDRRRRDGQVAAAKRVGELHPDSVGADGHVQRLPEGGIPEHGVAHILFYLDAIDSRSALSDNCLDRYAGA